jgi:hypothetical protein
MELLNMDKVKENNKKFILKFYNDTGNKTKTNELIRLFSDENLPSNYGDFILNGWLDKVNMIIGNK